MSLFPIIYSTILIFGGILIFVVIVSYVSFNVKNNENSYFEADNKENEKRNLSKHQIRELKSEPKKRSNRSQYDQVLNGKNLYGKKLKPDTPETMSEYRRERRKLNKKYIQVLYKEKDIFSRSKARTNEPRFRIIKDISENLGQSEKTKYAETYSFKTSEMIVAGANDYLRFYENY